MTDDLDLGRPQRVHIVGVGGAGMSAIATVLAGMGHVVSGSDLKASVHLERLAATGVVTQVGHRSENLGDVDVVAVSTAIPDSNPEVRAARARAIPVLRRAEMLRLITRQRSTIAVAGTHGKTTTSSMLALVLIEAGLKPSFIIGGDVNEIGTGAAWDDGELLVVEADESDGTFVELERVASIVTSVEPDHLEHYGGFEQLEAAFDRFVVDTPGPTVVSADDPGAAALAARADATTYGTTETSEFHMRSLELDGRGSRFDLVHDGSTLGEIVVPVPGAHNARNACAATVTALALGADFAAAARALARFGGVARRFEFRGESSGVQFVDDYAHLPTEVGAAVAAARTGDWSRIVCVFQPHRYSRTSALWRDFEDSFEGVDRLVVTDIYSAGEAPRPGVTGKLIVDAVLERHPWHQVAYLPHRDDLLGYLARELRPGDLCLTLGAGDLTAMPDAVQESWRE